MTVPEKNVSKDIGWTLDTLHDHLAQLIQANDKYYNERILSLKEFMVEKFNEQKDAVEKADVANQKHFESVNELQGTMDDQQSFFAKKESVDISFKTMTDKIDSGNKTLADKIEKLDRDFSIIQAKGSGMQQLWLIVFGILILASNLLGFFIKK